VIQKEIKGMDSDNTGVSLLGSSFFLLCMLAFAVLMIASMWKVFTKAGKPGWAQSPDLYIIVLLEIIGNRCGGLFFPDSVRQLGGGHNGQPRGGQVFSARVRASEWLGFLEFHFSTRS